MTASPASPAAQGRRVLHRVARESCSPSPGGVGSSRSDRWRARVFSAGVRSLSRAKDGVSLSVVIPFFNEADGLPRLLERLAEVLAPLDRPHEVILVDDGSTDDGWAVLRRPVRPELPITALRFGRNFGKEAAIRAGLERSSGDATVVMDADLQHPPELIPRMIEAWEGSDALVVEAVRSDSYRRALVPRLGARLVYGVLSALAGIRLDRATDFKLLDRRVVDDLVSLPERVSLFRGIVTWMGYPTRSIEFEVPDRFRGGSRWSLRQLASLGLDALTGFTAFPLRIVTLFSAIFILSSFLLILQTLYNYWSGRAVEGFTTVIIAILLVGGVITGSLGIIGEYLARVFDEVKARPNYVITETYTPDRPD